MKEFIEEKEGGWTAQITGSGGGGGGGKGKGGGRRPVEDPESLRSRSEATVVGVLCEGEVEGFEDGVDPLTRIYLDNVPIKNADGSFNYGVNTFYTGSADSANGKGGLIPEIAASIPSLNRNSIAGGVDSLVIDYRTGTQNQDAMPGFDDVRTEQSVNIRLTQAGGAVSRATVSDLFNKLRIRIGIGALFFLDKDTGDVKGRSVQFNIKIRPDGGVNFVGVPGENGGDTKTITGKSRGPVDFEYEYNLQGNGPWIVSVERLTEDPTSTAITDDLFFKAIVGIYTRSFRYPNTALMGIKIGAENFNAVPQLAADMLGLKIKVPTNYDPIRRTYSGIWNGTFKTAWSNNPAWVFYDLLTNTRYGAGEFINESQIDRYSLYSIAQYCDELVPDGKGGLEPRMVFNAYITDRAEAYEVLNAMAAAFRGMLYFYEGTIVAIQDKPKQISKIFSPANVVQQVDDNGEVTEPPFSYEGTARKARKTVALVSWNDANDNYKAKVEYVEDRVGIDRYGYRETEVRAFGTTSQGQAQRIGRWVLLSDQLETETVTFKTATEGFFVLPGEVIGIADPAKEGKRYGGRIVEATVSSITIDAPFNLLSGSSYQLSAMLPDGTVQTRTVINGPGSTSTISLSSPLSSAPIAGAPWVLQQDGDGIRKFRVVSVNEDEGVVTVLGALYDEDKFALTDNATIIGLTRASVAGPQVVPAVIGASIVLEVPS
jgi:predicted phage tail protein